ncbi:hypothetical protein RMR21_015530 [Agrobacterium sp. rho-8.1]
MSIEKNTSTTLPAASIDAKSLMRKVKETITAMNVAESRSRKAMAVMVASFVEMGEAYVNVSDVKSKIDAECVAHGITPVNLHDPEVMAKNPNIFLPMMSIVDGNWKPVLHPVTGKPVKNKDGKPKQKWSRNRSFEKYASVIRFFLHNKISHEKVVEILIGDDVIEIEGSEDGVRPRISDIVAADTVQQKGARRNTNVWTDEAKTAAALFGPVAKLPVTDDILKSVKLSDGYAAVIVHVEEGELTILFDSGLEGDALFRVINKQVANLNEATKASSKEAA